MIADKIRSALALIDERLGAPDSEHVTERELLLEIVSILERQRLAYQKNASHERIEDDREILEAMKARGII